MCDVAIESSCWKVCTSFPYSFFSYHMVLIAFRPFKKLWKKFVLSSPSINHFSLLLNLQFSSLYFSIFPLFDINSVILSFWSLDMKIPPSSSSKSEIFDSISVRVCTSCSLLVCAQIFDSLLSSFKLVAKPYVMFPPVEGGGSSINYWSIEYRQHLSTRWYWICRGL